jgi:hypothetical protein
MVGVTVRNASPSDRKLILQLVQRFPCSPRVPMDDTMSEARITVKNEYLARAFRLFKRGRPFRE